MGTVRLATLDNIMQAQMLCDLLENEGNRCDAKKWGNGDSAQYTRFSGRGGG